MFIFNNLYMYVCNNNEIFKVVQLYIPLLSLIAIKLIIII